jgi:hypothetical protein
MVSAAIYQSVAEWHAIQGRVVVMAPLVPPRLQIGNAGRARPVGRWRDSKNSRQPAVRAPRTWSANRAREECFIRDRGIEGGRLAFSESPSRQSTTTFDVWCDE